MKGHQSAETRGGRFRIVQYVFAVGIGTFADGRMMKLGCV